MKEREIQREVIKTAKQKKKETGMQK